MIILPIAIFTITILHVIHFAMNYDAKYCYSCKYDSCFYAGSGSIWICDFSPGLPNAFGMNIREIWNITHFMCIHVAFNILYWWSVTAFREYNWMFHVAIHKDTSVDSYNALYLGASKTVRYMSIKISVEFLNFYHENNIYWHWLHFVLKRMRHK